MSNPLRRPASAKSYSAGEQNYTKDLLQLVLISLLIIDSVYTLSHVFNMQSTPAFWLVLGAIICVFIYACIGLLLLRFGYVMILSHPTSLVLLAVPIFIVIADGSLSGPFAMGGIMLAVTIAGMLHPPVVMAIYTLMGIFAAAGLYLTEFWEQYPLSYIVYNLIAHSGLLIILLAALTLVGKTLRESIQQLSDSEENLALRNAALERQIRERQQAEMLYERVVELSPDPFVINKDSGEIEYVNPAFALVLGYPQAEILGRKILHFVHHEDRAATLAAANVLAQSGQDLLQFENRYTKKDGSYRWFSWNVRYVQGLFYGFARDITEEKLARQAVIKNEELLNQTGSMAKVGGWEYNITTKALVWTAQMYAIYEVADDFVPERDAVVQFYTPDSQEKVNHVLQQGAEQGHSWDLELEIVTAKGNRRWVRDMGSPKVIDGKLTILYGTFQDITARKQAELVLLEREQQLSLALRTAEILIWIWTFETDEILVSDVITSELRFRTMHYNDFFGNIHPEDRPRIAEAVRTTRDHDVPYLQEYRYQRPNETQRWIVSQASLMRDNAGNPVRMIGVSHDITQLKRAEQQQMELVLAQQRAHFLTEFLGNISHDLKTPLTVINSSLYLIERLTDPERRRQKLAQIEEQVLLLEKYIQDMITISRLENLPTPKQVLVNINDLLRAVEARIHETCERKKLQLHWWLEAGDAHVLGNDDELYRAFVNLLENAANYTPEGGTITISTTRSEESIQVQISDTGIGIPQADLSRIFERFYRSKEARRVVLSGTGLGLAIVKKIVDLHQGHITVNSIEGRGTTFIIQLPSERQQRGIPAVGM